MSAVEKIKRELFINEIDRLISDGLKLSDEAQNFFDALKAIKEPEKPKFTENGKAILLYVRENKDSYNNMFKAKDIGEGMGISSKTASGAMRKLVTDGYIEKIGTNPTVYSLTELGATTSIDE